jgi:Nuclease-related domain/Bacterial SH3 domain
MRIKQILLATLLTVSSLISFATDYCIATTVLNVRTGEGIEYSVSFTLQKGEEVEVLSKNGNWYRIKYFGKSGYVHSKYLKYSRTISDKRLPLPQQIVPYLLIGLCISFALFIVFFFFRKIQNKKLLETVTKLYRGIKSERDLVLKLLKSGMPAHVIFHDLYVKKYRGDFSQIDLVIVTDVGIIVFEVKDYSGWIFGSGNQSQWTQVLAYGKQKYRFYNPIMQNNKHVAELRKQLIQFGNIPFYSIVVFYGSCVLKEINFVPNGTFLVKSERVLDVVKIILKENERVHYNNVVQVFQVLKEAVINGGIIENQIRHKENIKDMLGKHRIFD